MKKLLTILFVFGMSFCLYAQGVRKKQPLPLAKYYENVKEPLTSKERSQIIEVYGDNAEKYVFSNPHRLKTIKHILRNRVHVKLISDDQERKPCQKLSEVKFDEFATEKLVKNGRFDKNNFNPLKYDLNLYSRGASMFQVDGTNYYIIINSQYQ